MLTRPVIVLFSFSCGLAVATIYFSQPLLDTIGSQFSMPTAQVGIVLTLTQIGYAIGLLLIVPLGDIVDQRRLIVGQTVLLGVALLATAISPNAWTFLLSITTLGALAVVTQVMVTYTAVHAARERQGWAVGVVTGGIISGILLARTVSGALSDLLGWRSVYAVAAIAVAAIATILARTLVGSDPTRHGPPYGRLLLSTLRLLRDESVLRSRAIIAMLVFAAITVLLTPMVLPLTSAPYHLSHTQVGLFGLAGAAGAVGAFKAGTWCDRGWANRVTGAGLSLMLAARALAATLHWTLLGLAVAVVIIDFGLQSVHVANQSLIYRLDPELHGRVTAAYMTFYSIGSAIGAIASTWVYAARAWSGVCLLGAAISLGALAYWAALQRAAHQHRLRHQTHAEGLQDPVTHGTGECQ
ncbi:Major facilitator family transporter [Mycobacteroides abscessus subsp. abscessus]|uniref:Major facilitator family transporter n=1 Tax=Mycobacteroides abscessus TaxID=36809 RepID=A0AB33T7W8_9MYCO|nr:MFS transporter [Mycobacteroides abscessus]MDO3017512.1 MFS transporter [Mycobacteroides abscessus subsp. abscessus]MDO3081692.1 MFS transporter [Mycobacteroides abscessus subsp. abscessus]PVB12844.1 MFS transporter [Mycobacteroides abscessus]RIR98254.1 MFS transporter [Mycobacteroides abscessus]CPT31466.1 Major facilitator family transporter [Mycobacteroides abscessus]